MTKGYWNVGCNGANGAKGLAPYKTVNKIYKQELQEKQP
jgi:hypothetical protein